jgi:hypothetical protein
MIHVVPAAGLRTIVEAISGLQRPYRDMDRRLPGYKKYNSRRRAVASVSNLRESAGETKGSIELHAPSSSRVKRVVSFWPYILLAISLIGLILKLYRAII